MKIAILSFYSGKAQRGVETWAESLKENLKDNFEISIYSDVYGSFPKWIKSDIVIPVNGRFQAFFARLATWLTGKPMIIFGHSGLGADDKWNLLCSPNIFVAFTDFQKNWADKYKLPWTEVIKISHAVDTGKFLPAENRVKPKIVLCVAANTPINRVDLVRGAVELLPDVKFSAVGKGNETQVSFKEMPGVYKRAGVFCYVPSPWNAFGLVFLEAMSANLPVVTSDDPIRREIVGDAGLFVKKPEDSKELSEAINKALEINWKDRPRKQSEKFDWKKTAPQYAQLFKETAK
jgi:glycosyltransferase involved in cell wall biosynthesis